MSAMQNKTKTKLEHLLRMQKGFVLELNNGPFADFVKTSVGIDIYAEPYTEGTSKAVRLRQFWQEESNENVVKLCLELLEHADTERLMEGKEQSSTDQKLEQLCRAELEELVKQPDVSDSDLQFLGKDFGAIDITHVPVALDFRDVIQQRTDEIEKCLRADAPLAVIFLAGSTLEGLLSAVALKNTAQYLQCKSAPQSKGKTKPLSEWTLENLIVTSSELGIVGQDVVKHAHAVKDFRNYIHPRQQIKDSFTPRLVTARIAYQVLQAAIADLSNAAVTN